MSATVVEADQFAALRLMADPVLYKERLDELEAATIKAETAQKAAEIAKSEAAAVKHDIESTQAALEIREAALKAGDVKLREGMDGLDADRKVFKDAQLKATAEHNARARDLSNSEEAARSQSILLDRRETVIKQREEQLAALLQEAEAFRAEYSEKIAAIKHFAAQLGD